MSLTNCVALVTGATRGIGKGIALQLGEAGVTVYITGRTLDPKIGDTVGGSLRETAAEIEKRGGRCIPVQCNHKCDEDIKQLFEKISSEQEGRLDILVNNAYSAVKTIIGNSKKLFYETDISVWDEVNIVGLRNNYICSVLAARLMVPRGKGLIINITSDGGKQYFFNVAYGVGKQAVDRLTADTAIELKSKGVAVISLCPGLVRTENMLEAIKTKVVDGLLLFGESSNDMDLLELGESIEFSGKAVVHLASDEDILSKSGQICSTIDLADSYGYTDINGCDIKTRQFKPRIASSSQ